MKASKSGTVETTNPATGEHLESYPIMPDDEVMAVAKRAHTAFEKWRKLSIDERSDYLRKLATALRAKKKSYAKLMTLEMGKPITQAESEVEKCAWTAEHYAEHAKGWLAEEHVETDAKSSYVEFDPLGVILSVMPWNYPFWQVLRFAIPTVVAGNTSILRHSNSCPGSALAVQDAFESAGFPQHVFTTVITAHDTVAKLIASKEIAGVSLTASVEAGQRIGGLAAQYLKKSVLELGGSDPYIVLEDADVKQAAKTGAEARVLNNGQSCIAAKRFIVEEAVAEEFIDEFASQMGKKKTGDPMDPRTDVGPLVNVEAVRTIYGQVRSSIAEGARVRVGGKPLPGKGAFYPPTVLDRVKADMKVIREEVFGPAAPVLVVRDEKAAVRAANDSDFGLGSSLWTTDLARAKRVAKEIQSGMVFVNALTKSDPRMPFGGVKKSGIGRELSKYGLKEFVNVKSVNIYGI
ncbi:MAG TPA: NAD-dependent succinate-semialdehyde dehydrogenase [Nitrososphaerales archaeon]|nr:NAD-dependent succinate-semialdehyde dehydrogenase [Nitrososphaerales archaeon]